MSRKIDETGQTFGRLLVVQEDTRIKQKHAYWSCLCACGNSVKGKYQANIRVDGKLHHLGYFNTVDEAAVAREKAEGKYWRR